MPLYSYIDDRDGKVYDIIQKMSDKHIAFAEDGHELRRLWEKPLMSVDSKIDENDSKSFVKYTSTRSGNLGNLQDLSAELSQKRADKNGGIDPQKEVYYENYKKSHKKEHVDVRKRKLKEEMKSNPLFDVDI